MPSSPPSQPPARDPGNGAGLRRAIIRRSLQLLVQQVVVGIVLFVSAGTWRWPRAWLYLGLTLLLLAATAAWVLPRNPEVVAERGRRHRGTRWFDKVILTVYTAFGAAVFIVCGLDAVRFGWAPLGWGAAVVGAVLITAGMIPAAGAMVVNRNLEPTARIQEERGHQVATTGPYRHIRHPMYFGIVLQLAGLPLLLGSAWGLLPAAATAACIVVRTGFEDRMLRADLPGYAEYAARTRYRLVPGLW